MSLYVRTVPTFIIILPPSYCPPAAHWRSLTGPLFVISPFRTLSFPKVPRKNGSGKYCPRHDSRQGKPRDIAPEPPRPPGVKTSKAGPPTGSISNQPPASNDTGLFTNNLTCTSARPDQHADPRTMTAFASPSYLPRPRAILGYRPVTPPECYKTPPSLHPVLQNTHMPGGKLSLAPRTARLHP